MNISPIDRVYVKVHVAAKDADGDTITLPSVDVTALPFRTDPAVGTTWVTAPVADGVATILVAGPLADPSGAVSIPAAGARLWLRVVDNPETQAVPLDFISVS